MKNKRGGSSSSRASLKKRAPRTPEGFTWPGLDQATAQTAPDGQTGNEAAGATDTQTQQTAAFTDMTFSSPPAPSADAQSAEPALETSAEQAHRRRPTVAALAVGGALVLVVAGGVGVASSMGAFDRGVDADSTVTSVSTPTPVRVTTPPDTAEQSGQTTQPQSLAQTPSAETTEATQTTQDPQVQLVQGGVSDSTQLWRTGTSQVIIRDQTGDPSPSTTHGNETPSTSPTPTQPTSPGATTEDGDGSQDETTTPEKTPADTPDGSTDAQGQSGL